MWVNVIHSGLWIAGLLTALTAILIASPSSKLREFLYRIGDWITGDNRDFPG
jgi:hypothetical protein